MGRDFAAFFFHLERGLAGFDSASSPDSLSFSMLRCWAGTCPKRLGSSAVCLPPMANALRIQCKPMQPRRQRLANGVLLQKI